MFGQQVSDPNRCHTSCWVTFAACLPLHHLLSLCLLLLFHLLFLFSSCVFSDSLMTKAVGCGRRREVSGHDWGSGVDTGHWTHTLLELAVMVSCPVAGKAD